MVFSMNVFKNKKRWQNKKTLKTKKRGLNKNVKKSFFLNIYAQYITSDNRASINSKDKVLTACVFTTYNVTAQCSAYI